MKQKINGFLNSQARVHLSAVGFKCRREIMGKDLICKLASIYSLNSKQVSLWIFTSGQLNFVLFYFLVGIL